jgi:fluoroquinolone resistance protein
MAQKPGEEAIYKNIRADGLKPADGMIEGCTFLNCDFSYADLSHITFIDCVLDRCNLSLAKLVDTGARDLVFRNCKITGVNFSDCNGFSFSAEFTKCMMDYSIWHRMKLKGTKFAECSLEEADFSEADLSNAVFARCNLARAVFNRTLLKGADFSTAFNFDIDPENNTIAKAKFSAGGLAGLLTKYNLVIE